MWTIFGVLKPKVLIMTTVNSYFTDDFEVNTYPEVDNEQFCFKWNWLEFRRFCMGLTTIFTDYSVAFDGIGYGIGEVSHYCQLAMFSLDNNIYSPIFLKAGDVPEVILDLFTKIQTIRDKVAEVERLDYLYKSKVMQRERKVFSIKRADMRELGRCVSANDHQISKVLQDLKKREMIQLDSSQKPPVKADYWSSWPSRSDVDSMNCFSEAFQPPDFDRYVSDEAVVVRDLIYTDVFAQFFEEMRGQIRSFCWSLTSSDYPYTNKLLKLQHSWDFLDYVYLKYSGVKKAVALKLREPKISPILVDGRSSSYTDEEDGACSEKHRTYRKYCKECPFLYVNTIKLGAVVAPKVLTSEPWQHHIVYFSPKISGLFFSFTLIKRFLGYDKNDNFIK